MKNKSTRFHKQTSQLGEEEICIYTLHSTKGDLISKLALIPTKGAILTELFLQGVDVLDGYQNEKDLNSLDYFKNILLAPFPNRIEHGVYTFNGKEYKFPLEKDGNALHGFVMNKAFNLKTEFLGDDLELCLTYQYDGGYIYYPFPFRMDLTLSIIEETFTIKMVCTNTGESSMPIGLGWHPYFKAAGKIESLLNFRNVSKVLVNEHLIPTGAFKSQDFFRTKFEDILLDNSFVFEKNQKGQEDINIHFRNGKTIDRDKVLKMYGVQNVNYLHLYRNPTMDTLAIEPMTCNIDAFNNKNGLQILNPMESFPMEFKIECTDAV